MRYEQTKIYFDGSHYVGIPHTTEKRRFRPKPKTERFYEDGTPVKDPFAGGVWTELTEEEKKIFPDAAGKDKEGTETGSPEKKGEVRPVRKRLTKRGGFFRLYEESRELSAKERKGHLIKNLRKFFRSDAETEEYVGKKLKDKRRALIARRIRFTRKAQLNEFNYFVTVGGNKQAMEKYIQNQEKAEEISVPISIVEYYDPFEKRLKSNTSKKDNSRKK